MPRSGPISLSLPAFSGVTRKLILANVATFFAILLLRWLTPHLAELLVSHLMLEPRAVAHGELWQLFTYSFVEQGILAILFGMLTLWFTGSLLEPSFGSRWLGELYFSSVIGSAIIASAISFTHIFGLRPEIATAGCWSGIFGFLYVKFAPRRGFAFGFSERYFGLRNGYYRWKRRRAARKFEVYMRKQNREVHFDKDGRYVDPDELRKNPNDKRWMNRSF